MVDQMQAGTLETDPVLDYVCKKCVDAGLVGLLANHEGEAYCLIHGNIELFVPRWTTHYEPKFRGQYESELIRRFNMSNDQEPPKEKEEEKREPYVRRVVSDKEISEKEVLKLARDIFLSVAGIRNLPDDEMKEAAAMALSHMFYEYGADARLQECGIFPLTKWNKRRQENDIVGWGIWTGYKFHWRLAQDISYRMQGRQDFYFGEDELLDDSAKTAYSADLCIKCRGTGKYGDEGKCFECNGQGRHDLDKVIAVRANLFIISSAEAARSAGIVYYPIKCVSTFIIGKDDHWKTGTPFEKATKRAQVACLRRAYPIRNKENVPMALLEEGNIIMSEQIDDPGDATVSEDAFLLPEPTSYLDELGTLEGQREEKKEAVSIQRVYVASGRLTEAEE